MTYYKMVEERVQKHLQAEAMKMAFFPRSTYGDEGMDVMFDVLVLWNRGDEWATHRGTIRCMEPEAPTADLFYGHYDMNEKRAHQDYLERCTDFIK
jgi:hypothetical protein